MADIEGESSASAAVENTGSNEDEMSSVDEENDESSQQKACFSVGSSEVTQNQNGDEEPMSKRKRKRLAQKLKKKQFLKENRQKERLRKKERLKQAREQGLEIGPSRKALKHNTMEKSQCKINVVIDCSFDSLMTEKDSKSIVKQVNYCYAANRRATDPMQFHVTSFVGQVKDFMEHLGDYRNWDINFREENFLDVFKKEDVVYLSSDSKNILQTLDDNKVYIIGGLVDHNHHKGICLHLAEKRGLAHAQLPIGDYVSLESRKTLAVNHVFEILMRYTETKDWQDAFYKVIPRRKVTAGSDSVTSSPAAAGAAGNFQSKVTSTSTNCSQNATSDNSNSVTESGPSGSRESEQVEHSEPSDNKMENEPSRTSECTESDIVNDEKNNQGDETKDCDKVCSKSVKISPEDNGPS